MASACASTSSTLTSKVSEDDARSAQLRVGRLTKAHGLKGAIKLELFTDDPGRRFVPGAVFSLQVPTESPWHGKTIELAELRWYNSHPVGFFVGIADRTAAEGLAKAILWIDQDDSESPDEEDAWYDHQLAGLAVVRDGVTVGTVARIEHFPAQDIIIVKTPNGEVMVPFVKAIVSAVDVKGGTVTVTPPNGLFEEIPDDEVPADEASAEAEAEESTSNTDDGATASIESESN